MGDRIPTSPDRQDRGPAVPSGRGQGILGHQRSLEIKDKKMPVKILAGGGADLVLKHYGITRADIASWGGSVNASMGAREAAEFDIIIDDHGTPFMNPEGRTGPFSPSATTSASSISRSRSSRSSPPTAGYKSSRPNGDCSRASTATSALSRARARSSSRAPIRRIKPPMMLRKAVDQSAQRTHLPDPAAIRIDPRTVCREPGRAAASGRRPLLSRDGLHQMRFWHALDACGRLSRASMARVGRQQLAPRRRRAQHRHSSSEMLTLRHHDARGSRAWTMFLSSPVSTHSRRLFVRRCTR